MSVLSEELQSRFRLGWWLNERSQDQTLLPQEVPLLQTMGLVSV